MNKLYLFLVAMIVVGISSGFVFANNSMSEMNNNDASTTSSVELNEDYEVWFDTKRDQCVDRCFDGVCNEYACNGVDCACTEDFNTCPADCW